MDTYSWIITGIGALTLIAFAISLTSLPERFLQWRRRVWESDSQGNLD